MKNFITYIFSLTMLLIIISGCSNEQSATQKVLPHLVASEKGKFNMVVFYEDELPSKTFQDDVNKARDYLLERDKLEFLYYIDVRSYDFRSSFHGLTPPHLIIFDNKEATINATKPDVLFKNGLLYSLIEKQ